MGSSLSTHGKAVAVQHADAVSRANPDFAVNILHLLDISQRLYMDLLDIAERFSHVGMQEDEFRTLHIDLSRRFRVGKDVARALSGTVF